MRLTGKILIMLLLMADCSILLQGAGTSIPVRVLRDSMGNPVRYGGDQSGRPVYVPLRYGQKVREFRGVWVSTMGNIDFGVQSTAQAFQSTYRQLLWNAVNAGFTAIIFQVRPSCDAFYPSKYNPWSRYLTGSEGKCFSGFDPLAFMIAETHRAGLEFHAWLNPYRVGVASGMTAAQYCRTLSSVSFAAQNPDKVMAVPTENGKTLMMLNPGEPAVLLHLSNTVRELLTGYDVDAIHFDDYFYPYAEVGNLDLAAYRKYGKARGISLPDWRRNNVDMMVQSVHNQIQSFNQKTGKRIRFGISPFGIWANKPGIGKNSAYPGSENGSPYGSLTSGSQSYVRQYADTRKWVKMKWVDYIVPQLYWSFQHNAAPYAALADWWADTVRGTGVDLYIGLGVYRQGVSPDWNDPAELSNQLKYTMLRPEIKGVCLFSAVRVFQPDNRIMQKAVRMVVEDCWKKKLSAQKK